MVYELPHALAVCPRTAALPPNTPYTARHNFTLTHMHTHTHTHVHTHSVSTTHLLEIDEIDGGPPPTPRRSTSEDDVIRFSRCFLLLCKVCCVAGVVALFCVVVGKQLNSQHQRRRRHPLQQVCRRFCVYGRDVQTTHACAAQYTPTHKIHNPGCPSIRPTAPPWCATSPLRWRAAQA